MNWLNTFSNVGVPTTLFSEGVTWNGTTFTGTAAEQINSLGTFTVLDKVDVSNFLSYDINFQVGISNQGSATAALGPYVQLIWYDDLVSGIPVFEEDWYPWGNGVLGTAGLSAPSGIIGTGPMHGRYMTISIQNVGSTLMQVNWMNVYGTNRPTPQSDWRQNLTDYQIAVFGFTNVGAGVTTSFENALASSISAVGIPSTPASIIPLALFAGPIYYDIAAGVSALAGTTTLVSINLLESGGVIHARQGSNVVWDDGAALSAAANVSIRGQTILPRAACALVCQGNAAGTSTLTWDFIAQQGA